EDIPLLVEHFVGLLNAKYNKRVRGLDPKVMAFFQKYPWPGNIRELQRVLEYAFVFVKGPVITPAHLPDLEDRPSPEETPAGTVHTQSWEDERETILRALRQARGRRGEAARRLGLSRSTLWRKMKAYNL
ncbi:MAG: helix-turn-helix domain-containing protein, partial [Thermodesulfobacteriota bacterium]